MEEMINVQEKNDFAKLGKAYMDKVSAALNDKPVESRKGDSYEKKEE